MTARRDAALFLFAALVPAAATGLVGWRALRNEEAALRREAILEVSRQAERVVGAVEVRVDAAEGSLSEVASGATSLDDRGQNEAYERAARVTPPFAAAFVLDAEGKLLRPKESKSTDARTERVCADNVARLSGPDREQARLTIVESCEDARDASGRWLWPVLALERVGKDHDEALETRLAGWFEGHADRMRAEERAVTLEEVSRSPDLQVPERQRSVAALSGTSVKASSIARVVAAAVKREAFARALRSAETEPGRAVSFAGDGVVGAFIVLDDGGVLGFVVTLETLRDSLSADAPGWAGLDPALVATAVSQARAPDQAAAPEGIAWITSGLGVRVRHVGPRELRARTTRSERILVGLIATGIGLALAFAYVLYRRMQATRRTSELRTSFVAGISHELRTPLASVRMLSELLAEGRVEENERAEVAEALAREAKRMSDTVERFMAYAKSERGKLLATKKETSIDEIVDDRVAAFRERHPGTQVEVDHAEVTAHVDRPQIEIVLDNLLENAKKYAADGQPYVVSLTEADGVVSLAVRDSGPGVAPSHRGRIFEAFERGDDRLSRATSGTGLGLFLVRTIARAHGGEVSVESAAGAGAKFVLRFPRSG